MDENGKSVEVTRTYLQMTAPDQLKPARSDRQGLRIERAVECPPSFFRYLYREVGRFHHWTDRLEWTDEEISRYLSTSGVSLWVMYVSGAPAGYFELLPYEDGSIEVAYFGLLPEFLGRGLGKHLLSVALEQAWSDGAERVWLHTCTLDGPAALPNYLKRGLTPFKQETYRTIISPDEEIRSETP